MAATGPAVRRVLLSFALLIATLGLGIAGYIWISGFSPFDALYQTVLSVTTQAAGATEAEALQLAPGAPVHVYDGLSLADGQPVALFQSMFPADRLPDLPQALEDSASVTQALAACGVSDYTRVSTRITAKEASATQALHLQIAEGAPILRTVSVNADPDGVPVEFGRTWFAGDRVTLTVGED